MKASAQASFSYGTFQASASVSYEKNEKSSGSNQSSKMSNSLIWEAEGGDTILCNEWVGPATVSLRMQVDVVLTDSFLKPSELVSHC